MSIYFFVCLFFSFILLSLVAKKNKLYDDRANISLFLLHFSIIMCNTSMPLYKIFQHIFSIVCAVYTQFEGDAITYLAFFFFIVPINFIAKIFLFKSIILLSLFLQCSLRLFILWRIQSLYLNFVNICI